MSFRNERFNARCLSLEEVAESIDPAKSRVFSDSGEGAERICRAVDSEDELDSERGLELSNERLEMLLLCKWFLNLCGEDRLVPVLDQIVDNGTNRRESIWRLSRTWRMKKHVARVKYHQGVRDLLTFFSPNEIKGETHIGTN